MAMTPRLLHGFVAAALVVAIGGWLRAQDVDLEVAFRAATETETVKGDLKAAIEQYRSVANGGNRNLAARALMRMAECYQKLGDLEARKLYDRIVREYADQRDVADIARTRLGTTSVPRPTDLRTERVYPRGAAHDRVSPDGRYLAFVDWNTGNLAARDLENGRVRMLTADGTSEDPGHQFPLASAFSRDGRYIAYDWYVEDGNRDLLRIVTTRENATPEPRTIYDNPDLSASPTDWSADGRWIAVVIRRKDHTAQIGIVSVAEKSLRVLKTVDWAGVGGLRFSPDGSTLAYHRPSKEGAFEHDVFVIALDGSHETLAAGGPSDDTVLEWMPGGDRLLISSDRGGSQGVWSIRPSATGSPADARLVKSDIGTISSLGLTQSGSLYYHLMPGEADVYVASLGLASRRLTSTPVQPLKQFKGFNTSPEWSPDGRFLAYKSFREIPAPINTARPVIVIQSMETGLTRELFPTLSYMLMGKWSPDGRLFIGYGADLKGRSGMVKVDTSTGEASLVVAKDVCSSVPFWATHGRSFFCSGDWTTLLEIDSASQAIVRKYSINGSPVTVSPDGRTVLVDGTSSNPPALRTLSLDDGTSKDVFRFGPGTRRGNQHSLQFTPDGRSIAFFGQLDGASGLWIVPLDGGTPSKIDGDFQNINHLRFNPRSDQVAFSPGGMPRMEVWKMENFLPRPLTAQMVERK